MLTTVSALPYVLHCDGSALSCLPQRWLVIERRVIRQKFQNAVKNNDKFA